MATCQRTASGMLWVWFSARSQIGVVWADDNDRYNATNSKWYTQDETFVIKRWPYFRLLVALIRIAGDQLQKESKNWLCPPDPSKNYNVGCEIHRNGTAKWFLRGSVFAEWNTKGSLLWIYGKRELSQHQPCDYPHSFVSCTSWFGKDHFSVSYISPSCFIYFSRSY